MLINLIEIARAGVITDAKPISSVAVSFLNFLLATVGILAIIMLVVSGTMYFFSFGDEKNMEKAKQASKYSVFGIILIMGALVVIRVVGQFFGN